LLATRLTSRWPKPRPSGRGKVFKLLFAKEELKKLKVHPRETYDDVIKRLIEEYRRRRHEKD
jgi:hypothetical protein